MGICKNNLPPHSWRRGPVFNNSRNANVYFLISRASNTFCQMGCGMLSSIGDFLKMGSDEIIRNMYDISDDIDEEDSSSRYFLSTFFSWSSATHSFFFESVLLCNYANVNNFVSRLWKSVLLRLHSWEKGIKPLGDLELPHCSKYIFLQENIVRGSPRLSILVCRG